MKCLQCGSERIAMDVRAIDRGDHNVVANLSLQTYRTPSALIFKGAQTYQVAANVCGDCGMVVLSVPKHVAAEIYLNKGRERDASV